MCQKGGDISQKRLDFWFLSLSAHLFDGVKEMTDQQLALQAINEAQLILEEYLRPRPQNNERILDRLVEVLERPDLVVARKPFAATKQSRSAPMSKLPTIALAAGIATLLSVGMPDAQAKQQCSAAAPKNPHGAVVVLSSDRWTKVLVPRQAHAFEIVAGMAQAGIRATRFQRESHKHCHAKAWQSIGRASPRH